VPGHTQGQLAFLVDGTHVFTGDTLFRRAVGGTRAPGHATFEDLRRSILDVLVRLPAATVVHPGHTAPTTVGEEWERNPFIRLWRGLDEPGADRCTAFGRPATLLLRATDYDGGTKCQVRFEADGRVDIVPGSQVR
jgi:glyoxylase-like metal-dependent hydrolase (beta-lactamase superfamily II)